MKRDIDKYNEELEIILQRVTKLGGFDKLDRKEVKRLEELSLYIEKIEDSFISFPIKNR